MSYKKNTYIALYGNVKVLKSKCPECKRTAFVIDGCMACCGAKPDQSIPNSYKRESDVPQERKRPPKKDQRRILDLQENRCIYCGRYFGTVVYNGKKNVVLKIHWDHFVPFAYSQNNKEANFLAACNICNLLKCARMFQTVEEAQVYLQNKWQEKDYKNFEETV